MPILRDELYAIAGHWNTHSIRPVSNSETPNGKPDVLYFLPETQGHDDFKCTSEDFLLTAEVVEELCCTSESIWSCTPKFQKLASMIMEEEGLIMPKSVRNAEDLYIHLQTSIESTRAG